LRKKEKNHQKKRRRKKYTGSKVYPFTSPPVDKTRIVEDP